MQEVYHEEIDADCYVYFGPDRNRDHDIWRGENIVVHRTFSRHYLDDFEVVYPDCKTEN